MVDELEDDFAALTGLPLADKGWVAALDRRLSCIKDRLRQAAGARTARWWTRDRP